MSLEMLERMITSDSYPSPHSEGQNREIDSEVDRVSVQGIEESPESEVERVNEGEVEGETEEEGEMKGVEFSREFDRLEVSKLQRKVSKWLFSGPVDWAMAATFEEIMELGSVKPEICFLGRSNVGKSSLINALLNSKVARVSGKPGATKAVHYVLLRDRVCLIDLPGYGYARVAKQERARISGLIMKYLGLEVKPPKGKKKRKKLSERPMLRLMCILIDARRGVGEGDRNLFKQLDNLGPPYLVVVTKADKLKPEKVVELVKEIELLGRKFPTMYPEVIATSSGAIKTGLDRLRVLLLTFSS
eukprot:TRINITY_DN6387_c0_g1_i1.p1 TRINITY_DN6387_c0_g1~~TRINITY_DN6387_c0_g1_i1.p1  ORF type:complete len:303 (-),score=72.64 TRINITY_DN6387_c0_g1_i1:53-961(-)